MDRDREPLWKPLVELALDSGRMIRSSQVHIGLTYGDYLHSAWQPDVIREVNQQVIRQRNYPAALLWPDDLPSVLLDMKRYMVSQETRLPLYKLIARFESGSLENGNDMTSTLVVIWFQDDPHPLLSRDSDKLIRALDWESLAEENEY
ncbi:MAG: hypothetical protein P1S46_01420 [bacterium]|nr:hypothetical protein [bacterium]MDT8394931.1 hypothetical protein [bacterium]